MLLFLIFWNSGAFYTDVRHHLRPGNDRKNWAELFVGICAVVWLAGGCFPWSCPSPLKGHQPAQTPSRDAFLPAAGSAKAAGVLCRYSFFYVQNGKFKGGGASSKMQKTGSTFYYNVGFSPLIVAEQLWTVSFDVKTGKFDWPTAVWPAGAGCVGIGWFGRTNTIGGPSGMRWGCGSSQNRPAVVLPSNRNLWPPGEAVVGAWIYVELWEGESRDVALQPTDGHRLGESEEKKEQLGLERAKNKCGCEHQWGGGEQRETCGKSAQNGSKTKP